MNVSSRRQMITPTDPRGARGLQHIFNLVGVDSNPDEINMSTIQPVIDMNFEGYAKLPDLENMFHGYCEVTMSGVVSATVRAISYGVGVASELVYDPGNNLLVYAMDMQLQALNGTHYTTSAEFFMVDLQLRNPAQINPVDIYKERFVRFVNGNELFYIPEKPIPRFIVPDTHYVEWRITSGDCSNWTVPTYVNLTGMKLFCDVYGLQAPIGAPLPQLNY